MKNFSKRLDSLRGRGETKKDFAGRIGVSPVQLSRYYSGVAPGRRVLARISGRTGVSMDWLLYGSSGGTVRARRLGAMSDRPLDDQDRMDMACSYIDEMKGLNREEKETLKELIRETVRNPDNLEKLATYLGFLKFQKIRQEKSKKISEV
jgi:transcriptional regulator with XRE-family HTH domain